MPDSITELSAAGLARRINDGELSPMDVTEAHLERIRERNDRTNAFITVCEDVARGMADSAQAAIDNGDILGPLHGVPIAIKDLYDVKNVRTTSGSLLFEERVAEADAPMVERLKAAGAVIVGKTNTPEFGWGTTTDNRLVGPTSTPFDTDRTSGGSSGGAGAALADGLVPLAQGSDGGGSIRTPASFCGVYGLKPTYGIVPNTGRPNAFTTHAPFINQGPMARRVEDAALMMDVMAGADPRDPFSVPTSTDFRSATDSPIDDLTIAYSSGFGAYRISQAVRETLDAGVTAFDEAGASVEPVELNPGHTPGDIRDTYYTLMRVLYHSLFDNLEAEGFDPRGDDAHRLSSELVEFLGAAPRPTTRECKLADRARTQLFDHIQELFREYDLLVTATLGVAAFPHGRVPTQIDGTDIDPRREWLLTQMYNLTGHPAASIPAGFVDGLPVGMQIVGRRYADADVLATSAAFERIRPWQARYPR